MDGEGKGGGIYSGFVQPVQHITSKFLRDVSEVDAGKPPPSGMPKNQVSGAKKIFQALEAKDSAITLTKWSDVTGSEMISEFKKVAWHYLGF
jgi:hypothetical protein